MEVRTMKTTRCLVYVMDYGAIEIETAVEPTGMSVLWRECDIKFSNGIPVVDEGEFEEPIPLFHEFEIPINAEEMLDYVIDEGIKDQSLHDATWVTLAEY